MKCYVAIDNRNIFISESLWITCMNQDVRLNNGYALFFKSMLYRLEQQINKNNDPPGKNFVILIKKGIYSAPRLTNHVAKELYNKKTQQMFQCF